MKRPQWQSLINRITVNCNRYDYTLKPEFDGEGAPRLYVVDGKRRGQVGEIVGIQTGRVRLAFANGEFQIYPYSKVEEVGENGEPDIQLMRDMMGEEITNGSYVAYSQSTRYSHALEIGKVKRVTAIGTLVVVPLVRNSQRSKGEVNWYTKREVTRNVDATRCVKLPTDPSRFMMAILTDFESVGTDYYG